MTYFEAVKWASRALQSAGVPDPGTDAHLLMEYASGKDRAHLLILGREKMPEREEAGYREAIRKRMSRIPLQQIAGKAYFMGLEFHVSGDVLIPRQDTEILAEAAIDIIGKFHEDRKVSVLDLCTGSGCLAVSIAHYCGETEVTAADISPEALKIAKDNAEENRTSVRFIESDLFDRIPERYDLIVSNPPYIRSEEIPELMEEVKNHEPHLALDGGPDGLHFYRKVTDEATAHLREGGFLLYEIGKDQGEDVRKILQECGFREIRVLKDFAGLDRVVCGRRI